jgi:deoxycytidine triphosphate deaminase
LRQPAAFADDGDPKELAGKVGRAAYEASMAEPVELPDFPKTDGIAAVRFERWRDKDPFPDVPPALLNSADLLDYVATVGMLSPYEVTAENRDVLVKPASCAVRCTGDFLRFDFDSETKKAVRTAGSLTPGEELVLPANTITYLHLGTTFRIPDYIAARFNLAIREIHRGFLVGTGPLVDPGFVGRLFIPLHNLTSNDYRIRHGDEIVWVEFTKLSPNEIWDHPRTGTRRATFAPFPPRKLKRTRPVDYLHHASGGEPIASSIPEEIERATSIANEASRRVQRLQYGAIAGLVLAGVAAILPIVGLVSDTNDRLDAIAEERTLLQREVQALRTHTRSQGRDIRILQRQIQAERRR